MIGNSEFPQGAAMREQNTGSRPMTRTPYFGFNFGSSLLLVLVASYGCVKNVDVDGQGDMDPLNTSYTIGDQVVTLVDGFFEVSAAPGSNTRITTAVWGTPEMSDLNGDGRDDAALVLIHDSGGSGTFYYVVAAIRDDDGFRGTSGVFLGDRIAPRDIVVVDNRITVNYLERAPGDDFASSPSVPAEQLVIYDPDSQQLAQVARDFEGEADPGRMTLQMKTWFWVKTIYNDGAVHTPVEPDVFSLTFGENDDVRVTTDCNTMRGRYLVDEHKIQFEQMASTRMFCEGSQEQQFAKMLENVSSYFFTDRGQLVLEIKFDSGSLLFR
jgi:heat shock protein HslJ